MYVCVCTYVCMDARMYLIYVECHGLAIYVLCIYSCESIHASRQIIFSAILRCIISRMYNILGETLMS